MGSPAYWGSDMADLSTVNANPSIYSGSDVSTADQVSQIAGTIGQWGATIASVVTGNPTSNVVTPSGQVRTLGAAGSTASYPTTSLGGNTGLLLLVGLVVVAILVFSEEKK